MIFLQGFEYRMCSQHDSTLKLHRTIQCRGMFQLFVIARAITRCSRDPNGSSERGAMVSHIILSVVFEYMNFPRLLISLPLPFFIFIRFNQHTMKTQCNLNATDMYSTPWISEQIIKRDYKSTYCSGLIIVFWLAVSDLESGGARVVCPIFTLDAKVVKNALAVRVDGRWPVRWIRFFVRIHADATGQPCNEQK